MLVIHYLLLLAASLCVGLTNALQCSSVGRCSGGIANDTHVRACVSWFKGVHMINHFL